MTVKEFCERDISMLPFRVRCETPRTVIRCNTKEKAKLLLEKFSALGRTWYNGASYLEKDCWDRYKSSTCYTCDRLYCADFELSDGDIIIEFDDLDDFKEGELKMTVKEFWENKKLMAIHCSTEEKANKLLKKFNELGKEWYTGDDEWEYSEDQASYLNKNEWDVYKEDTCYDNKGCLQDKEYYENKTITVIEFDDLDDFKNTRTGKDKKSVMFTDFRITLKENGLAVGDKVRLAENNLVYEICSDPIRNFLHLVNVDSKRIKDIQYLQFGYEKIN